VSNPAKPQASPSFMAPADAAAGTAGFAGSRIICGDAVMSCRAISAEDGSNIGALK
jgi:hypothetical protein